MPGGERIRRESLPVNLWNDKPEWVKSWEDLRWRTTAEPATNTTPKEPVFTEDTIAELRQEIADIHSAQGEGPTV